MQRDMFWRYVEDNQVPKSTTPIPGRRKKAIYVAPGMTARIKHLRGEPDAVSRASLFDITLPKVRHRELNRSTDRPAASRSRRAPPGLGGYYLADEIEHRTPSEPLAAAREARDAMAPLADRAGVVTARAAHLAMVAMMGRTPQSDITRYLEESETVLAKLLNLAHDLERVVGQLQPEVAAHSRIKDVRKSISSARTIAEQAQTALGARLQK